MKRFILVSALLCATVLLAGQTLAQTLDFVPSYQTVKLGDEVVVCLHCSGLTPDAVDPAVGGFDIDVGYWDPDEILMFREGVFGPQLGDPTDPTETTAVNMVEFEGFVGVTERSLLAPSELEALQGRAVTLVCLTFKAKKTGSVVIGGDLYVVEDQFGGTLLGAFGPVGSATVEVVQKKKDLLPTFP
jgi:hypothetical protein